MTYWLTEREKGAKAQTNGTEPLQFTARRGRGSERTRLWKRWFGLQQAVQGCGLWQVAVWAWCSRASWQHQHRHRREVGVMLSGQRVGSWDEAEDWAWETWLLEACG